MLTHLAARDFRNLEPLALEFGGGAHLILGENGAGKTSLLETIYLLATTRSFRTHQIGDCRRHGGDGFELAAEVDGAARSRLEIAWRGGKRERAVNGGRTSLAEHLAVLPILAWTSEDTEILTGAPSLRRRFLDRGVVGLRPASLDILARYRQALTEKRSLLQRDGLRRGDGKSLRDELGTWNLVLADTAAELIRRRAAYVERLGEELRDLLAASRLGLPEITLRYQPSPPEGLGGPSAVLDAFEHAAARELRRQQALVGPHRDDLEIRWQGHEIRRVASAGERKALGLALLAAHSRVLRAGGRPPIHLLDDVDTELDRGRLEALWELFRETPQLFATSNRPWVWEDVEIEQRWTCVGGRIERS